MVKHMRHDSMSGQLTARPTAHASVFARARRAFTLIELAIVMATIALLLTLALPRYFLAIDHGKVNVQRQNASTIRDAIDKFFGDQGKYPDSLDDLVKSKYLRAIPVDPLTELPNWVVIAPQDSTLGGVYDIKSALPDKKEGDGAS
jgi:general secretion pathway protein G